MNTELHTYICFYRGKQVELQAESSYAAQKAGAQHFKAKKAYEVTAMLAGRADGTEVVHSTGGL
jgi:hypothetical protein